MVGPIPTYLSPKQLEGLEELVARTSGAVARVAHWTPASRPDQAAAAVPGTDVAADVGEGVRDRRVDRSLMGRDRFTRPISVNRAPIAEPMLSWQDRSIRSDALHPVGSSSSTRSRPSNCCGPGHGQTGRTRGGQGA